MKNDYTNAIIHFDAARQHMAEMGTVLASGIIKQFPDKFQEEKTKTK